MIHLIMVLSAIMLSSRSTGEFSIHSPITHPSPTSSMYLQRTDEINDKVFVDGEGTATLYGEPAKTSIIPQYPTVKKTKKEGYQIHGMRSFKPYVSKPFGSGTILQQDTRMIEDDEASLQKMYISESASSQLSVINSHQSSSELKLAKLALPKKEIVFKNCTSDPETAEDIPVSTDNKENNINDTNGTNDETHNFKSKVILHESDKFSGAKISYVEHPAHSEGNEIHKEHFTADFNSSTSFKTDENLLSYRRDRVKRSTRNEHNNEKKRNRTIASRDENIENDVSVDDTTTAENNTQIDDDLPETGIITDTGNNTANSSTNTTTSRRGQRRRRGRRRQHRQSKDLALWIDERQVKLFSGYIMEIFAIHDGRVLPYILDPNFEKHLPVIPFEVQSVNFTWQAGRKRYYYTFDRLYSHDRSILQDPVVSLPTQGRIPRKPKVFTVNINCTGNASGIAAFDIGLLIQTRRGKPLPGTPLRLKLRKECTQPSPDPECDEKCENGGVCDAGRRCQCPEGYMGQYCNTALCYPQCMNGGTCTTPGRCTCPPGYQGRHCEGGICRDKCENGGKCIQKDTCACPRGYYGNRCEFSKCVIPCINGGRCRNINKCRCPPGFAGDHCEIVTGRSLGTTAVARCSKKCRHGSCKGTTCQCQPGFTGRWCRRRGGNRKPVWL